MAARSSPKATLPASGDWRGGCNDEYGGAAGVHPNRRRKKNQGCFYVGFDNWGNRGGRRHVPGSLVA